MNKRTFDEMIAYFNKEVSNMDIAQAYKIKLLGMITAIGYESKKQEVVRCKDCKHHDNEEIGMVYCPKQIGGWVKSDWFCADGEKR